MRYPDFAAVLDEHLTAYIKSKRRGASQAQFARYLGVKPQALSVYMSGDTMPTLETLVQMNDVLQDERLFTALGLPPLMPNDPDIRRTVALLDKLTPEERADIVKIIQAKANGKDKSKA